MSNDLYYQWSGIVLAGIGLTSFPSNPDAVFALGIGLSLKGILTELERLWNHVNK